MMMTHRSLFQGCIAHDLPIQRGRIFLMLSSFHEMVFHQRIQHGVGRYSHRLELCGGKLDKPFINPLFLPLSLFGIHWPCGREQNVKDQIAQGEVVVWQQKLSERLRQSLNHLRDLVWHLFLPFRDFRKFSVEGVSKYLSWQTQDAIATDFWRQNDLDHVAVMSGVIEDAAKFNVALEHQWDRKYKWFDPRLKQTLWCWCIVRCVVGPFMDLSKPPTLTSKQSIRVGRKLMPRNYRMRFWIGFHRWLSHLLRRWKSGPGAMGHAASGPL